MSAKAQSTAHTQANTQNSEFYIVHAEKAVSQAKRGNRYARHFFAKYLLPADMTLSDIAAHEEVSGDLKGAILDQLDDRASDIRWRYKEHIARYRQRCLL